MKSSLNPGYTVSIIYGKFELVTKLLMVEELLKKNGGPPTHVTWWRILAGLSYTRSDLSWLNYEFLLFWRKHFVACWNLAILYLTLSIIVKEFPFVSQLIHVIPPLCKLNVVPGFSRFYRSSSRFDETDHVPVFRLTYWCSPFPPYCVVNVFICTYNLASTLVLQINVGNITKELWLAELVFV